MVNRIQLRRDTATNWTTVNPVLAQGEIGLETDTGKFKIGDGSTAWTSLNYVIPTKTSDLTNDSGFITNSYHDSTKYDASNPNGFITSSGSITGNAATATKANQDGDGNNIVATYQPKIFNKDKFTIVGSPTITSDGIASGFSDTNFLDVIANIDTTKNYEIDVEFFGGGWSIINSGLNYNLGLLVYADKLMLFVGTGSTWGIASGVQGITTIDLTTKYVVKFIRKNGKYTVKLLNLSTNVETTEIEITSASNIGDLSRLYIGYTGFWAAFTGSIDLKQFSIMVDGQIVFNGLYNNTSEIKHIVATSSSVILPSWWRVWSDGWIEQGGVGSGTVTLLKPFSNTNYIGNVTPRSTTAPSSQEGNPRFGVISNSQCYMTSGAGLSCNWYACGY